MKVYELVKKIKKKIVKAVKLYLRGYKDELYCIIPSYTNMAIGGLAVACYLTHLGPERFLDHNLWLLMTLWSGSTVLPFFTSRGKLTDPWEYD